MPDAQWSVPLADIEVDEDLRNAVLETVSSGWWSMGPRVAAFEEAFAGLCGTRHALAVANGTAALHLALLAAGCGVGDEVVLPSLNFVAAANVVALAGARPVFCDINGAHDLNLDVADLEAAITPQTKALLVLHYGGVPCDLDAVLLLAEQHGLVVIEDAAHAPGAQLNGRACGSIGAIGCFSFFSNKNLPMGEGGMIVTNDDGLAEQMRLLRSHGMTTLTWDRHRGHASTYDVLLHGFNYRLDELHAAIGSVELARLARGNAARRRLAGLYRERLDGIEGLVVPFADAEADAGVLSSHHLQTAVVPHGVSRDGVRAALVERRIQTSVHYPPIHQFSAFSGYSSRALPRTEDVGARLLTLPLFPHMRDEQVDEVVDALAAAVRAPAGVHN
jgi:dTDP-4-amino-4,6-dideoxygalactose transaminase